MRIVGVNLMVRDIIVIREVDNSNWLPTFVLIAEVKNIFSKKGIMVLTTDGNDYEIPFNCIAEVKRLYRYGNNSIVLINGKRLDFHKYVKIQLVNNKVIECDVLSTYGLGLAILIPMRNNMRAKVNIASIRDFKYV